MSLVTPHTYGYEERKKDFAGSILLRTKDYNEDEYVSTGKYLSGGRVCYPIIKNKKTNIYYTSYISPDWAHLQVLRNSLALFYRHFTNVKITGSWIVSHLAESKFTFITKNDECEAWNKEEFSKIKQKNLFEEE